LIDRWKVGDVAALDLIGHSGGLTKKGSRPRFKLTGAEAEVYGYLREIDSALEPHGIDPADWIQRPISEAPFNRDTPLTHHRQGCEWRPRCGSCDSGNGIAPPGLDSRHQQ
jgi:hypothetical protein